MRLIAEMAYLRGASAIVEFCSPAMPALVSVGQQALRRARRLYAVLSDRRLECEMSTLLCCSPVHSRADVDPRFIRGVRLRGAYFAIGTWVVSEVFSLLASLILVLGAGSGMSLTVRSCAKSPPTANVRDTMLYLMTLAMSLLVFAIVYSLLRRARLGVDGNTRSEPASASLGVNTFRTNSSLRSDRRLVPA